MQATATTNMNTNGKVQLLPVYNVESDIHSFIGRYKSERTATDYLRHIEEYFRFMYGKELDKLTLNDIIYAPNTKEKLLMKHTDKYKNHLKRKHPLSDSTILCKISAIRSLYKYLSINDYDVNHLVFDMQFLKPKPTNYDNIPFYLVKEMAELALKDPYAGEELSVFIYVAAQTSGRVTSLLKMKLKDIVFDHRNQLYLVDIIVKGDEKRRVPLDSFIFEKIQTLCKDKNKNDKVFSKLKVDWINKSIQKLATRFEELNGKRIVTHSLRHSAAVYEMDTSGDIRAVKDQTGHSSTEIAIDIYSRMTKDYNVLAGVRMMREVNEDVLDHVNKEDIIEKLKKTNPSAYHQLILEFSK